MVGGKRKNVSEFAVSFFSSKWLMLTASDLLSDNILGENCEKEKEIIDSSHIYLITKIPSFSFEKDSLHYENGVLSTILNYKINGEKNLIPHRMEFPLVDNATKIKVSEYPHREILTFNDESDETIRFVPANHIGLYYGMETKKKEINSFEVLYVGQAYGDGSRTTFERLKNHSTLQKILADVNYNSPDDEVYIFIFIYEPYNIITSMDGRAKVENNSSFNDGKRFYSILKNPLTEYQQICLIEAGLIRYFQPKFNKIYKDCFPSKKHKILEECYNLDFSGLVVEINTDELHLSLHSQFTKSKQHHIAKFNLNNEKDRYGFFHFTLSENEKPFIQSDVIS